MPDAAGPEGTGPRHAAPEDDDGPAPGAAPARTPSRARHRRRPALSGPPGRGTLLALVLAVLVVGAAFVPRLTGDAGGSTTGPSPAAPSSGSTAAAASPAAGATSPADWLAAALPPSTDLAATAGVREELAAEGVPADRLRPAEQSASSGSLLAVVGPAPEGARVVAAFDRPGDGSRMLVVDPAPAEPTAEELDRRRALADALLANPATGEDPAVTAVLRSGDVDARLLSMLAAVAAREGVRIAGFPALPGEEAGDAPARRVLVGAVAGAPVPADAAATASLREWLDAQLPPYRPDDVQVTDAGVLVSFHYASTPDALVSAAAG
ncbi:hypothetical protein [Geodermatophilus nigrescens]|uniref:Uncharacterized protein n=1 Tax=Geodermatophilus nigrescens TaxID=1070870 RepID=A0A1M5NWR7_9ACTN|nr:hypothetical protein [Geodermatophilus nigrescens]SHG93952.1 hypothetical protein SAMN05444351_3712 [Geodermatophilus nigrescens]